MKKLRRIAYVTIYDATDVRNWSGLGYHIAEALERQGFSLERIGPLEAHRDWVGKAKSAAWRLAARRFLPDREPELLHSYAGQVSARLKELRADLVFSPGTLPISYLECRQPLVFWTDATFASMLDFYPAFSDVCSESVRDGNAAEQNVLSNCSLAVFSSAWGAQGTQAAYRVDAGKVKVIPFGANLESGLAGPEVRALAAGRLEHGCKLLFVGADWHRKGGDIALEAARQLHGRGVPVELWIVGCRPPVPVPDYVTVYRYLSKKDENSRATLRQLYSQATFLVLPTRADTFGISIAEACAFGLPTIASGVGGIPAVLKDGLNGRTLAAPVQPECLSDAILDLLDSPDEYRALAAGSFEAFRSELNWESAGRAIRRLIETVG